MRVMTWNLWWRFGPWRERQAAIWATIEQHAPDIICCQELWSEHGTSAAEILGEQIGYHFALTDDPFGGRDVGFHNAILSRWPLTDIVSEALPNAAGEPGHRRALVARAQTPWGNWPIMSTHLDYRFDQAALREQQCTRVLEIIDERRGNADTDLPFIIGGDLNAVPDSDEVRLLTGRRQGAIPNLVLTDVWEARGEGAGHTWLADHPYQPHSAWPNRRIDYLFVSWPRPKPVGNPIAVWRAGAEAIDGVLPSDHLAVVADLVVPAG